LSPERIAQVNRAADSLEAGDVLLIPAVYHEETQRRLRSPRAGLVGAFKSHKAASAHHSTHVVTARRLPAQVLHRKAAVRTASLER
jgi:hypothetical protein